MSLIAVEDVNCPPNHFVTADGVVICIEASDKTSFSVKLTGLNTQNLCRNVKQVSDPSRSRGENCCATNVW